MQITDKEFDQIKTIMYRRSGVHLRPTKKAQVLSRLSRRLEELQMGSFSEYITLIEKESSPELEILINRLTTNETFFFRHTKQFNYFYEVVLPHIVSQDKPGRTIKIWSAASSSGDEAYSLSMTTREYLKAHPGWKYYIVASDINSKVLEEARAGIFSERAVKEMPDVFKNKYLTPYEDNKNKMWKQFILDASIRNSVKFMQHNLLKPFAEKDFDVIFLRNVIIYFDNESKQKVVDNVTASLVPGGHLFISLAESLNDIQTPIKLISSGVYRK